MSAAPKDFFNLLCTIEEAMREVWRVLHSRPEVQEATTEERTRGYSDKLTFGSSVSAEIPNDELLFWELDIWYEGTSWILSASISQLAKYGPYTLERFPDFETNNFEELVPKVAEATEWLIARAKDFDLSAIEAIEE
jgi:hypothetical protein